MRFTQLRVQIFFEENFSLKLFFFVCSLNVQKCFEVVDFALFILDQKVPPLMLLTDRRQLKSQQAVGSVGRPVVLFLASDSRQ